MNLKALHQLVRLSFLASTVEEAIRVELSFKDCNHAPRGCFTCEEGLYVLVAQQSMDVETTIGIKQSF